VNRSPIVIALLGTCLFGGPVAAWSQSSHKKPRKVLQPEPRRVEKEAWTILGRVLNLQGEPLSGGDVELSAGEASQPLKTVESNLKGEFQFSLDREPSEAPRAKVTVRKDGYRDAWEDVDFEATDIAEHPTAPRARIRHVELMLRPSQEDARQLSLDVLVHELRPRLRYLTFTKESPALPGAAPPGAASAVTTPTAQPLAAQYSEGAEELLDKSDPAGAVPRIERLVAEAPSCVRCRTLLALALLRRGSLASAIREVTEAARLDTLAREPERTEGPFLMLAVVETWRGRLRQAAFYFLEALDVEADDTLALQELGRVFVLEHKMKAADLYLAKAIKGGATADAHLLRAHALGEEGARDEAEAEVQAFLSGRKVKELPLEIRSDVTQVEDHLKLEAADKVTSVVDAPLPQLQGAISELQGIEPVASQADLPKILRKVGDGVKAFFETFPNTSSLEEVTQERLSPGGKVKESTRAEYQYLLLQSSERSVLQTKEYRTDKKGAPASEAGSLGRFMITAGFAADSLHFHPANQSGARFLYLGRQTMEGHNCHVVAFAQRPETATAMEDFIVNGAHWPVLVQGVAWIDASSYQIIRLRTDLLTPKPEIRLRRQTTDIRFGEVHFTGSDAKLWLPREVAVTVDLNGRILCNHHRYSDFRLFNVEAKEKHNAEKLLHQPRPDSE